MQTVPAHQAPLCLLHPLLTCFCSNATAHQVTDSWLHPSFISLLLLLWSWHLSDVLRLLYRVSWIQLTPFGWPQAAGATTQPCLASPGRTYGGNASSGSPVIPPPLIPPPSHVPSFWGSDVHTALSRCLGRSQCS